MTDYLDYKLGTSLGTLQTLATLGIPIPQCIPVHYAEIATMGDGSRRGVGWEQCEWRWETITTDEVTILRSYCVEPYTSANVIIKTVKTGGGMGVYSAIMWWPQIEPANEADCYQDFVIQFVQCEEEAST